MKYAFITNQLNIAKKCKNIDILYFGDEFCQNKIPNKQTIQTAYKWAYKNNLQFVLVLPYITNEKTELVNEILEYLNNQKIKMEVVFNDWGTFTMIGKYKYLSPVLGRLLTKQKKDPIAETILTNKQNKMKVVLENNKKLILESKKVPASLTTYFQKSYIDVPHVMDFMVSNNINRYELDLLPWGNKLNINKKIKSSIYFPYVNISTTRYCGAINLSYTNKCNLICQKQVIEIGKNKLDYPYIIMGNAIFYQATKEMLNKEIKNKNIDRIVINDISMLEILKCEKSPINKV